MSTVLIIVALVAVFAAVAAAVFYTARSGGGGRRGLKRRFGPEYDRALARHNGDTQAAERELNERVERYGALEHKPLTHDSRQWYAAEWAVVQERFVDDPSQSVAEADQLLGRLAVERGFPEATQYEDQLAALSVHHAEQVDGYRRVRRVTSGRMNTEELREAMVEARALFEALLTDRPADSRKHESRAAGHAWRGHLLKPKGSGV